MRQPFLIAAAIAAVASPLSAAGPDAPIIKIAAGSARAGWFLCDGIDGPYAALFGVRDANGRSVVTLVDRATGRSTTGPVAVGRADPGAGQIYYTLSRGGQTVGQIHMVNPGMVGNPVLPAVVGVELDGHRIACRFMPDMRFLGIAAGRSVMVRGQGTGLLYESFDDRGRGAVTHPDGVHQSNVPSLSIPDGTGLDEGGFSFANKGVQYSVGGGRGLDAGMVVASTRKGIVAKDRFLGSESVPLSALP